MMQPTDPLLGNDSETNETTAVAMQRPALCFLCGALRDCMTGLTEFSSFSECSAVQYSEWSELVGEQ
jgi:hypothetical protein